MAQQAVQHYGWLGAGQMLDGLGLAETTPGPLIIVTQFVGFLGAWNNPGQLPPILSATLGALVTTWTRFVPCFLWIFLGGPHIEQLRGNEGLTAKRGRFAYITQPPADFQRHPVDDNYRGPPTRSPSPARGMPTSNVGESSSFCLFIHLKAMSG